MDDAALVAGCLRGDRGAGDLLALRHGAALRALVRGRLGPRFPEADVENVCQQAWLKLLEADGRRLRRYDPARPLLPFLMSVFLNVCRDHLKYEKRRRSSELPEEVPLGGFVGKDLESVETKASVREALRTLPARDRMVLEWLEIESWSYEEVARVLGVPVRNVGTLLSRARQRLREALEKGGLPLQRGG